MKSQNERELSTKFKSTLFYCPVQISLLIHIGASSFREGDIDNANQLLPCQQRFERWTRQPPEQQAERRAREPPDKCSTPSSRQSNIVVLPSVPIIE